MVIFLIMVLPWERTKKQTVRLPEKTAEFEEGIATIDRRP